MTDVLSDPTITHSPSFGQKIDDGRDEGLALVVGDNLLRPYNNRMLPNPRYSDPSTQTFRYCARPRVVIVDLFRIGSRSSGFMLIELIITGLAVL